MSMTIKASYGADIRRFVFDRDENIRLGLLTGLVAESFDLDATSLVLKYEDDEGDLCLITSEEELKEAIRLANGTLKLMVQLDPNAPQKPKPAAKSPEPVVVAVKPEPVVVAVKPEPVVVKPEPVVVAVKPVVVAEPVVAKAEPVKPPAAAEPAKPVVAAKPLEPVKPAEEVVKPAPEPVKSEEPAVISMEPVPDDAEPKSEQKQAVTPKPTAAESVSWTDWFKRKADAKADVKPDAKPDAKPKPTTSSVVFLSDVTLADGSVHAPGAKVTKVWRVKNDGDACWPAGARLVEKTAGVDALDLPALNPAQLTDLAIDLVLPVHEGKHRMEYHLVDATNQKFQGNNTLWIDILIKDAESKEEEEPVEESLPQSSAPTKEELMTSLQAWLNEAGVQAAIKAVCPLALQGVVNGVSAIDLIPRLIKSQPILANHPFASSTLLPIILPRIASRADAMAPIAKSFFVNILASVPAEMMASFVAGCLEVEQGEEAVVKDVVAKPARPVLEDKAQPIAQPLDSEAAIHRGITCDHCGTTPIKGIRYQCTVCRDYDLCEACEAKDAHDTDAHDNDHQMLKIRKPIAAARQERAGRSWWRRESSDVSKTSVVPPVVPAAVVVASTSVAPRPPVITPGKLQRQQSGGSRYGNCKRKNENKPNAKFVDDLTIRDGSIVTAGTTPTKTWLVQNNGPVCWEESVTVQPVGGKIGIAAGAQPVVPATEPGQTSSVSVIVQIPNEIGKQNGYFRLVTKAGKKFGPRMWLDVTVEEAAKEAPKAQEAAKEAPKKEEAKEAPKEVAKASHAVFAPAVVAPAVAKPPVVVAAKPAVVVAAKPIAPVQPVVQQPVAKPIAKPIAPVQPVVPKPVVPVRVAPVFEGVHAEKLAQLHGMGFTDQALNQDLLVGADGDLLKCIGWLLNGPAPK